MIKNLIGLFLVLFLALGTALAKESYRPLPGAIPLQYGGYPATDLVLDGKVLLPQEAHEFYLDKNKHTRGKFTLADLDPEENDIWKNEIGKKYDSAMDDIPVADQLDEVSFTSYAITRLENYRFTVAKDHSFYLAYMGPKVHNFLLRRNLLRKLGYAVPAVKYLKNIKVNFNSVAERDDFLLDFQASVGRDIERWVTSKPEDESFFYAQDLIIMEDQNAQANLAVGFLDQDSVDGRRIYNSLIVPYALTDVPESINMLSWAHGRIYSENILLPYEYQDSFNCSHDDGVWMARRILSLTEADWVEIVENSHLPEPVAALLLEKLKSRRNHLATLFKIDAKKLKVDSDYTDQDRVVIDGKLDKEFFDGYGRRFKMPDPESPLSYGEMSSLFKAKALNQGIELLVSAFNQSSFMSNNVDEKIDAINKDISSKATEKLKNGLPLKGLVDSYVMPTVSGKIILGRDVVAGSYLGTDNLIQLVDTIGISVSAGAYGGVAGVFAKIGQYGTYSPLSIGGTADISLTRSYAHVKPIQSVKKALKYPFKNMLVPFLKRRQGSAIKEEALGKDYDKINALAQAERDKEYTAIFDALTKQVEVGESMIITDTVNIGAQGQVGANLYGIVNLRTKLSGNSYVISRLHILRKSETVFQVYKDLGQNNTAEATVALDKLVPILKMSIKGSKGVARTKFYNVELKTNSPSFKPKLAAIGSIFRHNSLAALNNEQKPFVIGHSFKESNPGLGLFVFRYRKLNSTDNITVTAPNGDQKKYLRRYKGYSTGIDFESYTQDLVGLLTSKIFSTQFSPSSFNSSNPGYTFHGKAFNKLQVYEADLSNKDPNPRQYTRLTRIWNGWQLKMEKAIKKLEDIKKRYKFNFMPPEVLAQTKKLFLYNINVNLYVHRTGIDYLMALSDDAIKDAFLKYQSRDMTNYTGDDALVGTGYQKVIKWKQKYQRALQEADYGDASDNVLKAVYHIEQKLTAAGFEALFGGKGNFLLIAKIDGFRIGDENGDKPLISNTFGTVGNDNLGGPTADVQEFFRQTGQEAMTEGEFYVNWLLGRLI